MLNYIHPFNLTNRKYMISVFFLALFWMFGFFLGLRFASATYETVTPLLLAAQDYRISIFGIFVTAFLPLVLSVIILRCTTQLIILPLALCKAFSFAFCSYCVLFAYGNAGWLVRWLLLFSDSCTVVILLLFWIRSIGKDSSNSAKDFAVCFTFAGLVGVIDYVVISPFWVMLFDN